LVTAVVMPQLGLEVTEGTVVELLVSVGALVEKDDPLVVLSTDKADTDVVAPIGGVVRAIGVEVGETIQVGQTLMQLADPGADSTDEDPPPSPSSATASADEGANGASASLGSGSASPSTSPSASASASGEHVRPTPLRIRVAPVARRAAAELGIALEEISGTGPKGRITLKDVRLAADSRARPRPPLAAESPAPAAPAAEIAPGLEMLSPLRRAVARRMTASQRDIPQFELVRDVDATHLLAQKDAAATAVKDGGAKPGVNDLLVQAIAETLVRHPDLAAAYIDVDGGPGPALRRPDSIDVGLAVATDRGLLVPVIRRAHERTLREIAAERVRLVAATRSGTLDLAEMTGGVITLSNLGSFGIDRFTAMVNPGESAIVAVGRTVDRLIPRGRGIAVAPILTLTLSCDHRVIDGATGARALSELSALLEGEMSWRT
jgi:pyruvate dehydrogenase E2 component (dihydrolipoamide acetyltransferase)